MTYELAKQLKYAGFPIKPYPEWALKMDGPLGEAEYRECYRPTLSELIEACGNDFLELGKAPAEYLPNLKINWVARKDETVYGLGYSPEEAVAKLWLALKTEKPRDELLDYVKSRPKNIT